MSVSPLNVSAPATVSVTNHNWPRGLAAFHLGISLGFGGTLGYALSYAMLRLAVDLLGWIAEAKAATLDELAEAAAVAAARKAAA